MLGSQKSFSVDVHVVHIIICVLDTAENYKEDGNRNFKLKKYRWAIDNYTAGIKALCSDRLLNAQLYTNRAASNFFIGE